MKTFLLFLLTTFLNGCSSLEDIFIDSNVLYLSNYENVKVVPQDSNLTGPNQHPIQVSSDRIDGALKLLLIRVGKKTQSLFPDEKLSVVTDAIERGLSKAGPKEDVVFTIESWYSGLPGTRLKDNRVVSGRIFYNKDGLNVIFGSVLRKGFQSTTDPMLVSRNPDLKKNPYVPGSRIISVQNPFAIAAPPNSGIVRPRIAKRRADWIVLTRNSLVARGGLTENERKMARSSNIEMQGLRDELQQLKKELRSMRNPNQMYNQYGNRAYTGYPQNMQPQPPYPYYQYRYPQPYQNPNQYYPRQQQPPVRPTSELTFKSLENMRSRGLISEENYLKKLKELGY